MSHPRPQLVCACIQSCHFISMPFEGATPKTDPQVLCALSAACVSLLWHVFYKTFFHKQQMDCCRAHLLVCTVKVLNARSRGGGKLKAVWRPGQRRGGCVFCGSPRFLKSGTLLTGKETDRRWMVFHAFIVGRLQLFLLRQPFLP